MGRAWLARMDICQRWNGCRNSPLLRALREMLLQSKLPFHCWEVSVRSPGLRVTFRSCTFSPCILWVMARKESYSWLEMSNLWMDRSWGKQNAALVLRPWHHSKFRRFLFVEMWWVTSHSSRVKGNNSVSFLAISLGMYCRRNLNLAVSTE